MESNCCRHFNSFTSTIVMLLQHQPMFLLLILGSVFASVLPSAEARNEEISGPRGGSLTLTCTHSSNSIIMRWKFVGKNSPLPTIIDECMKENGTPRCSREPALKNYTEVKTELVGNSFNLKINPLRQRNDGIYTCESKPSRTGSIKSFTVTVLVPPSKPIVTSNLVVYKEGQTVTLTCSSSNGNPKPGLTWQRQRRNPSGTTVALPPSSIPVQNGKFGVTSNNVSFQASADDDQATVTCTATNTVTTIRSNTMILKVQYKPRIRSFQYNPHRVVEGNSVQISCNAKGNPIPEVSWQLAGKNVPLTPVGQLLKFDSVDRKKSGIYTCTAKNSESTVSKNVTLDVLYPPSITIERAHQVREYNNVERICHVDANPEATVSWKQNGIPGRLWSSKQLTINRITRKEAGDYTCIASNTLQPSGANFRNMRKENTTKIVVLYPPSKPSVEATANEIVLIGQAVTLICKAHPTDPGVPAPTFEWKNQQNGATMTRSAEYQILRASLADNGEYRCIARNSQGQAPPVSVILTVDEKPSFDTSLMKKNTTVKITRDDVLSLYCIVRGKPQPQIIWLRNDLPIPEQSEWFEQKTEVSNIEVYSKRVSGWLTFKGKKRNRGGIGLRPADNANFTCLAKNNKGGIRQTTQVIVKYKPHFEGTPTKVAAAIGSRDVKLVCRVYAVPEAKDAQWKLKDNQRINGGGKYTIKNESDKRNNLFVSTVIINKVTPFDMQTYTCQWKNSEGSASIDIELQEQSVPERPAPVRIISDTWESMEMAWKAPFNGGFEQTLELLLSWNGQQSEKRLTSSIEKYNITGLKPRTNYTVQLRGRNTLGPGEYSLPVRHLTSTVFIPRIEMIKLDARTRTLKFDGAKGYCVRVEYSRDGGRQWIQYRDCLNPEAKSLRLSDSLVADTFRAFLCLARRPTVCSEPMVSEIVENIPDIPTKTIIVVAAVCALVILILVAVLLYFCCKRRQPRKSDFEANPPHRRPQAMAVQYPTGSPHNNSSNSLTSGKPYAMVPPSGYHDAPPPTEDRFDGHTLSCKPVFATSQSSKDPLRTDNQSMDLPMTPLTSDDRAMSPTPNGDSHSMMTKPRKVIYEVVV